MPTPGRRAARRLRDSSRADRNRDRLKRHVQCRRATARHGRSPRESAEAAFRLRDERTAPAEGPAIAPYLELDALLTSAKAQAAGGAFPTAGIRAHGLATAKRAMSRKVLVSLRVSFIPALIAARSSGQSLSAQWSGAVSRRIGFPRISAPHVPATDHRLMMLCTSSTSGSPGSMPNSASIGMSCAPKASSCS